MCVCVCVCVCVLNQVLLKTMEHCLLFSILFFKTPCCFSCVEISMVKELSHIFCPRTFDHTFGC